MEENCNMNTKYKRTEWVNNVTPLNAKNMNHIECAIEDLYNRTLEFNQVLAKEGIYVQQDLNNNLIIGQNVLFTTTIPVDIDNDIIYYIVDGDSNLNGVIIKGRILYLSAGGGGGEEPTEHDTIKLSLSCNIPTIIEYTGTNIETTISWSTTKNGEEISADFIEITKDNVPLALSESDLANKKVQTYVNKYGDTVFTVVARFIESGIIRRESITITQVGYSYVGFSRESDTLANLISTSKKILINKHGVIEGDYKNGNFHNKYLTICIPYELQLSPVYSQGIEVPMEYVGTEVESNVTYKKYRSVNIINPLSTMKLVGEVHIKDTTFNPDYYIGWVNMSIQDFQLLTEEEVISDLVNYTISDTPVYSDYFDENRLFVLAYNNNHLPKEVKLLENNQIINKDFPNDNMINRPDIELKGRSYSIWGVSSVPSSKITINFG